MIRPKISIVTITFNCADTLERAIKSIVSQKYDNLEYIIVDGGSTDGTLDIIRKYKDRITKWTSEPDKGISDAFNKGIGLATGEIVGLINSDDGLTEDALIKLADAYEPDIDVYRGKVLLWDEKTNTKIEETPTMQFGFTGVTKVCHQATFVTKKAYETFGTYDVQCKYMMDYDLLLRFYKAGAKMKYINETLAFYSLGGLTSTHFSEKRKKEQIYVMRKNGATNFQIIKVKILTCSKQFAKKVLGKKRALRIRNSLLSKVK